MTKSHAGLSRDWLRPPLLVLFLLCAVVAAGMAASARAQALPDARAYEMVSPPEKNGGNLVPDSGRTRSAADGSAVGFVSLAAFGDVVGTGVGVDYMSVRAPEGTANAGNGWATHAITPLQSGTTFDGLTAPLEPLYMGEFTPDLSTGVFFAQSPLTSDPSTASVPNLYMRTDLRTPGAGTYTLLTACPLCDASGRALLPPANGLSQVNGRPLPAGISPDGQRAVFESDQRLTSDTPVALNRVELYEWDHGTVSLVGRIPASGAECDDVNGPACVASGFSIAGQGTGLTHVPALFREPHIISDGSDGHTRVFFTRPTFPDGGAVDPASKAGQLYMRVDGSSTVQLNASERTAAPADVPGTPAAAEYLDASGNGERVFFMSQQALTNDAPVGGAWKIYMYDASKPASAPDNLTFLNPDNEPGDGTADAVGLIGASRDGHYAYLIVNGQLVSGEPLLGSSPAIYLWHDGVLHYVGRTRDGFPDDLLSTGASIVLIPRQARVTPDGRHLLYSSNTEPADASQRQLYLYDADTGAPPVCVSCLPGGAPATAPATDTVRTQNSGTQTTWHQNEAITDDGSKVFFSTAQALVPEDVNNKIDAYEYDAATGTVSLISSGTSPGDSWFMDASASGNDVFFLTRERLVRWDRDDAYDLYDARVGGGWPDPPPDAISCSGTDACHGSQVAPPSLPSVASDGFVGVGNAAGRLVPRPKPCRSGYVKRRVRGKLRCVKRPRPPRARARRARRARARVGRRRS